MSKETAVLVSITIVSTTVVVLGLRRGMMVLGKRVRARN